MSVAKKVLSASGDDPLTWTKVDAGQGQGTTITIPNADRESGDLIVIWNGAAQSSGTPSDVTPSGFTKIGTGTGGGCRFSLFAKLSDDTETTVTGINGTLEDYQVEIWRPSKPIASIAAGLSDITCSDSNPTSRSVAASGSANPCLVTGAAFSPSQSQTIDSESPAFDHYLTTAFDGGDEIGNTFYDENTTPSDQSADTGDGGSNNCIGLGVIEFTLA